jgi:hypothetical protein
MITDPNQLTWGSAPHPGSRCAPPFCGHDNNMLVRSRITVQP